ncbi:hypothetical protein LINGRAHAP2_LOCUS19176 [Linum grandiflorum]
MGATSFASVRVTVSSATTVVAPSTAATAMASAATTSSTARVVISAAATARVAAAAILAASSVLVHSFHFITFFRVVKCGSGGGDFSRNKEDESKDSKQKEEKSP